MEEATTRVTIDKQVEGHWRVTLDHPPVNTVDDLMYDELFDLVEAIKPRVRSRSSPSRARTPTTSLRITESASRPVVRHTSLIETAVGSPRATFSASP